MDASPAPVYEIEPSDGTKATLYAKMAKVMAALRRVEKRGRNTKQNYDFASAEDVKDMIRRAMGEQGLALSLAVKDVQTSDGKSAGGTPYTRYCVRVEYTIYCADSGASVTMPWYGEAMDYADKGFNKALTSATKYWLINTFLVSTGDEPDADAGAEPEEADAGALAAIVALYRAQNPSVKQGDDAIRAGLFDKVCGKGAPFTAANATRVALALAAKASSAPAEPQEVAA